MTKFFWVNQGATYEDELSAGCLWAPERDSNGKALVHWDSMDDIEPGDVIFTYARSHLRGIAVARSAASPMARPYLSGAPYTPGQGGRVVFCTYTTAKPAVPFTSILGVPALIGELQSGRNAPINTAKRVSQKYLCPISTMAAQQLGLLLGPSGVNVPVGGAPPKAPLSPTTAKALIDARVGQGKFRTDLLLAFGSACALTGLRHPTLLRASHIKAWARSSDSERLDPNNGLLLAAGVDAAFDAGYIGFDSNGQILVRHGLTAADLSALGVASGAHLPGQFLNPTRVAFLDIHRKQHGL